MEFPILLADSSLENEASRKIREGNILCRLRPWNE